MRCVRSWKTSPVTRRSLYLGKVRDGQIVPFAARRCAINTCRQPSAGMFVWPDDDTPVSLCEKHALLKMARKLEQEDDR